MEVHVPNTASVIAPLEQLQVLAIYGLLLCEIDVLDADVCPRDRVCLRRQSSASWVPCITRDPLN